MCGDYNKVELFNHFDVGVMVLLPKKRKSSPASTYMHRNQYNEKRLPLPAFPPSSPSCLYYLDIFRHLCCRL